MKASLVDLCVRVQRKRLGLAVDDPISAAEHRAMATALTIAASNNPGVLARIELGREYNEDELRLKRIRKAAGPVLDAVAREAGPEAELTPERLLGPCRWPWVRHWRAEAYCRLNEQGMTCLELQELFGRHAVAIGRVIRDHRARASEYRPERKEESHAQS